MLSEYSRKALVLRMRSTKLSFEQYIWQSKSVTNTVF